MRLTSRGERRLPRLFRKRASAGESAVVPAEGRCPAGGGPAAEAGRAYVGQVAAQEDAVDGRGLGDAAALGPRAEGAQVTPVGRHRVGGNRRQRAEELVLLPGHAATL